MIFDWASIDYFKNPASEVVSNSSICVLSFEMVFGRKCAQKFGSLHGTSK